MLGEMYDGELYERLGVSTDVLEYDCCVSSLSALARDESVIGWTSRDLVEVDSELVDAGFSLLAVSVSSEAAALAGPVVDSLLPLLISGVSTSRVSHCPILAFRAAISSLWKSSVNR